MELCASGVGTLLPSALATGQHFLGLASIAEHG